MNRTVIEELGKTYCVNNISCIKNTYKQLTVLNSIECNISINDKFNQNILHFYLDNMINKIHKHILETNCLITEINFDVYQDISQYSIVLRILFYTICGKQYKKHNFQQDLNNLLK